MEKMGLNQLRSVFQEFYESKDHYNRKSFSLIPEHDKSLLVINSGMAPMKPYFAGIQKPPAPRMTTCQKCIRTADIENVGITSRHGTFFEMLGSFSFGDYFKKESLTWGWEFITQVLNMPVENIWVSVYLEDDEAYDIWEKDIGFPKERIIRLGKEHNFWEIGTGPCGPCSEIYYDRGEKYGCDDPNCKPGCDCDRYVEFWNHVFTQFDNDGEGNYTELDQKNIDTGMGLERLACIVQDVDSIFDVDTIHKVLMAVEKGTDVTYRGGKADTDVSIRIITDHIRAAAFMIGDQILPGNEGRGYVLRRLIRRAARHGRKLGKKEAFLSDLIKVVVETCGEAYPELKDQQVFIEKIVKAEEEKFISTLDQGMAIIQSYIKDMKSEGISILSGERAFKLHDTYGFPIDITEEIFYESGYDIDRDGFVAHMDEQKRMGRSDAAEVDAAWEDSPLSEFLEGKTLFTGYDKTEDRGEILSVFKENVPLPSLKKGEKGKVVLDKTPFYAAGGGQESDIGLIQGDNFEAKVTHVEGKQEIIVHDVIVTEGEILPGEKITGSVDILHRNSSRRNHTATHLLHQALREVLGGHVQQSGSFLDDKGLRFDFSHFEAVNRKDLLEIENLVNKAIDKFLPVNTEEMTLDEAKEKGAVGLFSDKYSSTVRVVSAGDYSMELCGGLHVDNTGQIGAFKILGESGIASGIRRIEAITGGAVADRLREKEEVIRQGSAILKTTEDMLIPRLKSWTEENAAMKKELESFKSKALGDVSKELLKDAEEINGITLISKEFKDYTIDALRKISDDVKEIASNTVMVFANDGGEKVTFLVSLTDDVIERGGHAGKMIKEIAAAADGGGGGKADMAQAGGKDPSKINDALKIAKELVAKI